MASCRECMNYNGCTSDWHKLSQVEHICNHFENKADVVEVVRCKDCTYWGGKYASNECSLITQLANPDYWLKTAPDDFCSSGKRKGN